MNYCCFPASPNFSCFLLSKFQSGDYYTVPEYPQWNWFASRKWNIVRRQLGVDPIKHMNVSLLDKNGVMVTCDSPDSDEPLTISLDDFRFYYVGDAWSDYMNDKLRPLNLHKNKNMGKV